MSRRGGREPPRAVAGLLQFAGMLIRGGAFDEAAALRQPLHHAEEAEADNAKADDLAPAG